MARYVLYKDGVERNVIDADLDFVESFCASENLSYAEAKFDHTNPTLLPPTTDELLNILLGVNEDG